MFECDRCNKQFGTMMSLGAHRSHCGKGTSRSKECYKKQSESRKKFYENKRNSTPIEQMCWKNVKRKIFKERSNRCEECGMDWVDERGKGPYEIHHIDGNHDNNVRENLQVLCLNCHWKTPNWRFRGRKHKKVAGV